LFQVVNDPRYKDVMSVPLFSFPQIALVVLSVGGFTLSTWAYLVGVLPLWAAVIINVASVYLAFSPLHDASHRAVSSNQAMNDWLGILAGQLLLPGVNMTVFRAIHMDHHRYTGEEGRDPDTGLVEVPKFMGVTYLMFVDLHWVAWYFRHARTRWPKRTEYYVYLMLVLVVGTHVAFLVSPYWKEFLLLYVLPQRLGLGIVAYCFAHIQHPEGLTWKNEPFQSTVIIRGNSLARRLMFGQEDHSIHHLVPHVPWYKYRRVWELANGVLREQDIPERGFLTGLKEIVLPEPAGADIREVRISETRAVTDSITLLTLAPADEKPLKSFHAGSHINVHLPSGAIRQYSLVNSPAREDRYQFAVKREANGRGGSIEVHDRLRAGDVIRISKPHNNFVLYENAERFILISGGIGITPLLSMAHRLDEIGKAFELHVCAAQESEVPFADLLTQEPLASKTRIHLDIERGKSSLVLGNILSNPRPSTLIYICGPQGFMKWIAATAKDMGWASENVRMESFSAPTAGATDDRPFTVELAHSRRTINVASDQSVIDALLMNNVSVEYACLQGTCGTCTTKVLAGSVDHRDAFFTDDERAETGQMCLCVSRAKGARLVLDL
jgi:vanillate O-demethylase ferredoxin subunit